MHRLVCLALLASCSTEQINYSEVQLEKKEKLINSQKKWEDLKTGRYSYEVRRYLGPSLQEMNFEWMKVGFNSDRATCRAFKSGVSLNGSETIEINLSWTESEETIGSHPPEITSLDQIYTNCIDYYDESSEVSISYFKNGLIKSCTNSKVSYFLHEIKIDVIDCNIPDQT